MARILVLNNYSLERVQREVQSGDKPDHHLYGLNYFTDAGHEVRIAPHRSSNYWSVVERLLRCMRFPIPLGDLAQQAHALRHRRTVDLIYAPCQTQTSLLAYLRWMRLQPTPMVCLAHHPFDHGRLAGLRRPFLRANLQGTNCFPSLSRRVAEEINGIAGCSLSEVIPWGPQRDYYPIAEGPGDGALAAGRTGRDFSTFGKAATEAGTAARIICLESGVSAEFAAFGPNVRVDVQPDTQPLGYQALTRAFAAARVLAIPMLEGVNLAGLTSLADALGVGRPVIITRNPCIDLDVEALGIGRAVDPGDVRGWVEALRWFESHADEAMQMGRRARGLVDGGLNSLSFANRMLQVFEALLLASSHTAAPLARS